MKQDDTRGTPKKRNFLGPKQRGGKGRKGGPDARPTPEQQDSIAQAISLGRSSLGRAVQRQLEALDAVKPLYLKDDTGFAPMEDVPDHTVRQRAADFFCDRFGIPKRVETDAQDPFAAMLLAVATAIKETADE